PSPPPPRAAPFPYTTPFRSRPAVVGLGGRRRVDARELVRGDAAGRLGIGHQEFDRQGRVRPRRRLVEEAVELDRGRRRALEVEGDRKSTRLNSSHVKSSYAV